MRPRPSRRSEPPSAEHWSHPAYDFFARPFDAFALEEGHTFTIIPWVGLKDTKKAVWLGTTYKMTATGVEALTDFAVDALRIV
jgi:hypothetical protein